MKKKSVLMLLLVVFVSIADAGIYRHDVSAEKYKALAAEPQFDCVGRLFHNDIQRGACVFIGDRFVLTSADCFYDVIDPHDTLHNHNMVIIVNQPTVKHASEWFVMFKDRKYQCKAIHIYADYLANEEYCRLSLTLLELEQPVTDIAPAIICKSSDELHARIVGVGYGTHGTADKPDSFDNSSQKIAGQNIIDSFCGNKINGKYPGLLCDFDRPANKKFSSLGSRTPLPLEYLAFHGDEGGGAFRKTKSGWELIGISEHSGVQTEFLFKDGLTYYGQTMKWLRISVFADWINENKKWNKK